MRADLLEATEDSFEEVLRTNLQGPYFLTQAIARDHARARRRPIRRSARAIVFITSVSAEMASLNRGEYCVSKAGLAMAASLFAVRLAAHGIPVYEVRPGIIATDMTARSRTSTITASLMASCPRDAGARRTTSGAPWRRWSRGDLPYATGSVIHVDGGLAIPRL